jgi:hypothetical protein
LRKAIVWPNGADIDYVLYGRYEASWAEEDLNALNNGKS